MMKRPAFEFEVRDLLGLPRSAYTAAGILQNPFHFFSDHSMSESSYRKRLFARLLQMPRGKLFPYVTGHMHGGSGKTHILLNVFRSCAADHEVAALKLSNIVGYRVPSCAARLVGEEVKRFFKSAGRAKKVVILDEVEFPDLYDLCIQLADHVIAGGHYLERDSGQLSNRFQEIDLDVDWPLTRKEISVHVSHLLKLCAGDKAIPQNLVEQVVLGAANIGQAELVLGLLLATYTHRVMVGRRPSLTSTDITFWLSIFGTNWFWFSMDCWRIRNPVTTTILHSRSGHIYESTVDIDVFASIRRGLSL